MFFRQTARTKNAESAARAINSFFFRVFPTLLFFFLDDYGTDI
jgi:hypothetical protein